MQPAQDGASLAGAVGAAGTTRPADADSTTYSAAQAAATRVLHVIAKGAVIDAGSAFLAYNDWAQRNTIDLLVSHSSRLSPGAARISLQQLHMEMQNAAVDARDIAEALGDVPIIVPLYLYTATDKRTRRYLMAWCCPAAGKDQAVVARLPVTVPTDASPALRTLARHVTYMTKHVPVVVAKVPQEISLVVSLNDAQRRGLQAILARTGVLSATGRVAPAPRLLPRPLPTTTEPPSRKDVHIQWWRALFPDTELAPGNGFRGPTDRSALHKAFSVILRPRPPTDDASLAEAHAQARSATLDAWLDTTLGRLEVNPDVPVVLPRYTTLGTADGAAHRAPAHPPTELADAFLRYIRVRPDGLLGTLLGGRTADAEPAGVTAPHPPVVAPHVDRLISVRKANERQLIAASSGEPTRGLGDVPHTPALLPIHVFGEDGLTHVRAHVAYHTEAVPRALVVPLHPPTTMSDCSVDIDGVAVNIRYLSSLARSHIWREEQGFITAAGPQNAALARQPVACTPPFTAALTTLVVAAAKRVSGSVQSIERAAATLRDTLAARRPVDLALATSASLLAPPPLKTDAQAAVMYVFKLAKFVGVGDLSDQLVSVPASGAVTLTNMQPTVDAAFIAPRTCDMYLLPSTSGSATEPVRIVTVGVTHAQAVAAVRDIVAAIVEKERISGGSTGSVRAGGLAARGTHDKIVVGGGALVPLAILTLLLLRHSRTERAAPFAFIKM